MFPFGALLRFSVNRKESRARGNRIVIPGFLCYNISMRKGYRILSIEAAEIYREKQDNGAAVEYKLPDGKDVCLTRGSEGEEGGKTCGGAIIKSLRCASLLSVEIRRGQYFNGVDVGAMVFANVRHAIALGFLPTRPSPRKALSVRIPLLKF